MNYVLESIDLYKDKNYKNNKDPDIINIPFINDKYNIINSIKHQYNKKVIINEKFCDIIVDLVKYNNTNLIIGKLVAVHRPELKDLDGNVFITILVRNNTFDNIWLNFKINGIIEKISMSDFYKLNLMNNGKYNKNLYGNLNITFENIVDQDKDVKIIVDLIYKEIK